MSKPQLPAGTFASLTGCRYFGFRGAAALKQARAAAAYSVKT